MRIWGGCGGWPFVADSQPHVIYSKDKWHWVTTHGPVTQCLKDNLAVFELKLETLILPFFLFFLFVLLLPFSLPPPPSPTSSAAHSCCFALLGWLIPKLWVHDDSGPLPSNNFRVYGMMDEWMVDLFLCWYPSMIRDREDPTCFLGALKMIWSGFSFHKIVSEKRKWEKNKRWKRSNMSCCGCCVDVDDFFIVTIVIIIIIFNLLRRWHINHYLLEK